MINKRIFPFGFLFGIVLAALMGADKPSLTAEQMIGIPSIGTVSLSPNGRMVAFDLTTVDWEMNAFVTNIWLMDIKGNPPFAVTRGKSGDFAPSWSPDGRSLAFISLRSGAPQVYVFVPGEGEPTRLFEAPNGVEEFSWSPDGNSLAFLTPETKSKEKEELSKKGFDAFELDDTPPRAQLYLYEISTQKIKPLACGDFHVIGFTWSPDGKRIAFVSSPKRVEIVTWETQTLCVVNNDGSGLECLDFKYHSAYTRRGKPIWSPDGRFLALEVGDITQPELSGLIIQAYDFQAKKSFCMSKSDDQWVSNCCWSADGKNIFYLAPDLQNQQFFSLDVAKKESNRISHFPKISVETYSIAADGRTIAFSASTPSWPEEIFLADINKLDEAKPLTHLHADLENTRICETEEVTWKSSDGLLIYGNIVYPAGYVKGKPYPTVLLIHGGPAGNFDNSFAANYYCPAQYYAGRGYLVFIPNIRGSIGWGSEFLRKNYRDWGGGDFKDLMTGLDRLIERGLANKDRLFVWGGSYGGYMTNWIVTQTNRFKAASSEVSIADLTSLWSVSPIGRLLFRHYFGKTPQEDPDIYSKLSPITYAKNVRTPLLLTQNDKDERVTFEQAIEFYRAVELTGTPVRLFVYPGETHGTRKPNHQLDKLRKTTDLFEKYLK